MSLNRRGDHIRTSVEESDETTQFVRIVESEIS